MCDLEPPNSDDIASLRDSASTSTSGRCGIAIASCGFASGGVGGSCACCSAAASDGEGGAVGFAEEGLEKVRPFHIHFRPRISMLMFPKGFVARIVSFRFFALKARDTVRSVAGFSSVPDGFVPVTSLSGAGGGGMRESIWLISTLGYPDSMSLAEGTT